MSTESHHIQDIDKTAHDVDQDEKLVERVTLDSASENGIVKFAYVDTRIRANDNTRYLYVLVEGCTVAEVARYITALRSGIINRDNLRAQMPYGADILDIMPLDAKPRIQIYTGM